MDAHKNDGDCRAEFHRAVTVNRRRKKKLLWILAPVGGLWLLALAWPAARTVGAVAFVVGVLILLVGLRFVPALLCPRCGKSPENSLGDFCPECGLGPIAGRDSWTSAPHCEACGRKLGRYKARRRYQVRFCTHCDAHLDDTGV